MRFLVLNWKCWDDSEAGGAEANAYFLSKYLVKKGHKVTYFCRKQREQANKKLYKRNILSGEKIDERIRIIRKGNRISVYIFAMLYYIFKLRKEIDFIIDVHNGIPWFTPIYSRKPRILIIHHLLNKLWFKIKDPGFPLYYLGYFMEQWLMPLFYRKTSVVTVSPSTKKEVIKSKFNEKTVFVAYNGISEKLKPGKKSKVPFFLYLGRIEKYKDIENVVDLGKDLKTNVKIIGQGRHSEELEKYVKSSGASKYVKMIGFVSEAEKTKALQEASVFVMPSKKEGWGITSIEANKCGTVAIAFDVEGLRDSIKDGKTGFLAKDYADMLKKTKKIIEDKKLSKKMEDEAIKWASKFTWENYGKTVLREIENVAKKSK